VGSRGVLSARQEEILLGTILGDGHLEKNGNHTRLRIDHFDKQKEYVLWMAREFKPFSLKTRQIIETDKREGKVYSRWHFSTRSMPIFDRYRKLFYDLKRKRIPIQIIRLLNPLSLAIWYMDDGFRRQDSKGFYLCTLSYTEEEQQVLQEAIFRRFGLATRIHNQEGRMRIFIPSASADEFNEIIKPFILPIFRYKLL
jgi:recombination protein RecA